MVAVAVRQADVFFAFATHKSIDKLFMGNLRFSIFPWKLFTKLQDRTPSSPPGPRLRLGALNLPHLDKELIKRSHDGGIGATKLNLTRFLCFDHLPQGMMMITVTSPSC